MIKGVFDTHIGSSVKILVEKIEEYDEQKNPLVQNILHCINDTPSLANSINDNTIDNKYAQLGEKYNTDYTKEIEDLLKNIADECESVENDNIDQLSQQNKIRTIFKEIQQNCTKFAQWVTEHMKEIDVEVAAFNTLVDEYVKTIPDLTEQLIACINRNKAVAENDVRAQYQANYLNNLNTLSGEGDVLIREISGLLDELAQLEAAGT
jgi:hypothetical protein